MGDAEMYVHVVVDLLLNQIALQLSLSQCVSATQDFIFSMKIVFLRPSVDALQMNKPLSKNDSQQPHAKKHAHAVMEHTLANHMPMVSRLMDVQTLIRSIRLPVQLMISMQISQSMILSLLTPWSKLAPFLKTE